jgi:UDP-N-acetylglucosamine--N-acetylmuramyl-(pentapeptide) pyrophosphoryl-undecaprenol N-acetylglucosamine transferase
VTGNPVRPAVLTGSRELARRRFGLEDALPTLLVTGGGTGALALNALVAAAVPELVRVCQVIHLTGAGRAVAPAAQSPRYRSVEFLTDDMPHALAAADLVVSRAGMGTLTELAALRTPALIVPMPRSHQLANAEAFARLGAVEVAEQETLDGSSLATRIRLLLGDPAGRAALSAAIGESMPRDAGARIARVVLELVARDRGPTGR